MIGTVAIVAVLACLLLAVLVRSVRPVPPQHNYVVELFGRYRRTLEPGVHVLIPLLESVRSKLYTGLQSSPVPPVATVTSDDRVACVSTVVTHQVTDPVRATYEISDHLRLVEQATEFILRNLSLSMTLDWMKANPRQLTAQLTETLREMTATYGVQIYTTEITAINEGSRAGCG
jgi:regulator of protease activity HflC (stomatin/prohibitin superfamily)